MKDSAPRRSKHHAAAILCALALVATLALAPGQAARAANGPVAEASRLFDTGDYQQAITLLRGVVAQDMGRADAHYWLMRCYFELGNWDQAIASAEHALEFASNESDYHLWLGRAYGRKAEHAGIFSAFSLAKKTRQEFEEAVRLNPSNLSARRDLIEFYFSAPGIVGGGEDKAQRQIEELSRLDPVEAHLARAQFYTDKKKTELAEPEYRQVLAAQPRRVKPYYEIADFYMARADAARVEEAVERAARVDPRDPQLNFYRGVARVLAGSRLAEAEQMLRMYLRMVPNRSDYASHSAAHHWLGRLYERQGKCDAAGDEYRQAIKLDSNNKNAQQALRGLKNCATPK